MPEESARRMLKGLLQRITGRTAEPEDGQRRGQADGGDLDDAAARHVDLSGR